ncbi:hypothetical protein GE115_07145 [Agromyces sp. CFH 90414]|uniref:DUF3592 domain-containing protein n=1 Tax=Agromyces agglutinans TaxID=2662258 RepID=A0A6I2F795_9MICO|nr:hypothetical protein [Agromyces agglutinans]MRG59647.1 hypothetical protein [Agromyces agglutinans]
MPASEILSLAVEVLSWVGLGLGVPLAVAALIARLVDAGREEVEVVVVHPQHGEPILRWFAGDELHERAVEPGELDEVADHEDAIGYASGDDLRFHRRGPATRVLTTVAIVLLAVGTASLVASVVLMFTA